MVILIGGGGETKTEVEERPSSVRSTGVNGPIPTVAIHVVCRDRHYYANGWSPRREVCSLILNSKFTI